jgi:Zn-dependent M28 family amino/carboxypeptidase
MCLPINKLEAGVLKENLRRHIQVLSFDIGERNLFKYENLEKAARYIKQELESLGYHLEEQVYSIGGKPYRNLIATKKGINKKDKIIIVCAHYDSVWGSPGADDNASAVAGLLELARLLCQDNLNKTIKFIAFTNEEPPIFMSHDMGSLRYAKEARRKKENIEAVLCLESLGFYSEKKNSQSYPLGLNFFYPDKGNFIGITSNFSSAPLLKKIVKEFKNNSSLPIEYLIAPIFFAPAISFSDNWSFWRFGYKAVMITDTAFYRNPYYHTAEDTPDKLNYASITEVIEELYPVLLELGK